MALIPSEERVVTVEKVIYSATIWVGGYILELRSGSKSGLQNAIQDLNIDADPIEREVLSSQTESNTPSRVSGLYLDGHWAEIQKAYNTFWNESDPIPSKINAIKCYRELTGLGLKESKDAVDSLIASGVVYSER